MITIIKNGKFTGTQYSNEQFTQDVQEFHLGQNETWINKPAFNIEPPKKDEIDFGEPNEDGEIDYIEPTEDFDIDYGEPTEEELAEAEAIQLEAQRKQSMLDGADYNGYQVSLTKDDGDGLVQVKNGFELGLTNTTIHFKNGAKMPITATEFPAFASWFVTERNKFFI